MLPVGSYTLVYLFSMLIAYCACASLGGSSIAAKFGSELGLTPGQYQTWREWAKKRSFGTSGNSSPWGHGLSTVNEFQDWREFMNKRGFHVPDSPQSHQQFQSWLDWNKRQGLLGENGHNNPFPSPQEFNKFRTFQNWGDWYSKRAMGSSPFAGHGAALFGGSSGVGGGMQSWDEFMKRKGFAFGGSAQGLGQPNAAGLQSWSEWAKRIGPITTSDGRWGDFGTGGFGWGNKQHYTDWRGNVQHSANKRQLGYTPHSFGSFHHYFTDGLQDWRSTFKGSKRSTDNGETSLEQDPSAGSEKGQEQ